jgi:hypothetical protein
LPYQRGVATAAQNSAPAGSNPYAAAAPMAYPPATAYPPAAAYPYAAVPPAAPYPYAAANPYAAAQPYYAAPAPQGAAPVSVAALPTTQPATAGAIAYLPTPVEQTPRPSWSYPVGGTPALALNSAQVAPSPPSTELPAPSSAAPEPVDSPAGTSSMPSSMPLEGSVAPLPYQVPTQSQGMAYGSSVASDATNWGGAAGCAPYGGCGQYTTWGCGITGAAGGCGTTGACGTCGVDPCRAGCGYWFGGVYGLLMERDQSSCVPVGFAASGLAVGGYPTSDDVRLFSDDAEVGYQGGVEARLGRTFGCCVDPCTGCSSGPRWGLEGVYWQIFDQDDSAFYYDNATMRTQTMIDFRGLRYDDGDGLRPVNHYYDYAPPVSDYTSGGTLDLLEVRTLWVRRSFEATNFELNLLRLSACGGGASFAAGPAACGPACDSGCNGCALNPSGMSYRGQNCCGSRFSCTGVLGFRYLEFDDLFALGVVYQNVTTPIIDSLTYQMDVENRLAGFQLGCNNMYRIGCRWGIHLNTLVGVYGNDIDVHQRFITPANSVTYFGSGDEFGGRGSKTDVAMVGEMRLGASYQCSCHCRLYGGWRVLGVTGVALADDQIPGAFNDSAQLGCISSDGSLLVHGLQTGLEWNY